MAFRSFVFQTRFKVLLSACLILCATLLPAGAMTLHGKITARAADTVSLSFNTARIAYFPFQKDAVVAPDGTFSLNINLPANEFTIVELKHGAHVAELLLEDHDSLRVTVDANHFDSTIHYTGRGAAAQNFVAAHTLKKGRMNQYSLRLKEALSEDIPGFEKKMRAERNAEADFLKSRKKDLPARFVSFWTAYYDYYDYFFLQQYPQVHEILRLRRFTDTIPDSNYRVVATMPLAFHDSLLQVPSYMLYLTGAIELKMKADGYRFFQKDTLHGRIFRDSLFRRTYADMPPASAEFYVAQSLYAGARTQPLAETREMLDVFHKHFPQSPYSDYIEKQVAITARLEPGQPAPEIIFTDSTGARIPLSSLRGKVVYIEFWSGWCRQCLSEMLREQKVKDLEKNQPVVFAYVSLGDDIEGEKELLKKYKVAGLFMNVKGSWNAPEAQAYGIQSLPAYFLVDMDGNFAVRNPSSPNQSTQQVLEIGKLLR